MFADDLAIIAEGKQELQEMFGGMEGVVQEAWTESEPREDRSDVG